VQYSSSGIASYRVFDWRANKIIGSSASQAYIFGADYAPFGEIEWSNGSGYNVFGGITNATASDEYDALARKQHPVQGRWLSPDPAGLAAVDPTNPQTWNRYAYVANSPLDTIDPSGKFCLTVAGSSACSTSGGEPDPNATCYESDFCDIVNALDNQAALISEAQEASVGPGFSPGNSILPGENSLNFPLGPSPAQILNDILTGNFGDLLGIGCQTEFGAPCEGQGTPGAMSAFGGATNCTPGEAGCFNVPTQQQQEVLQIDAIYNQCQQNASAASGPMAPNVYQWEASFSSGLVSTFGPGGAGTLAKFARGVGVSQAVTFIGKAAIRTSILNSCLEQNGIPAPSPNGVR